MEHSLKVVHLFLLILSVRTIEYSDLQFLGCVKPFFSTPPFQMGASTLNIVPGIAACEKCNLNEHIIMLRGGQCYCIQLDGLELLIPVDTIYCNIKCGDNNTFYCGGNLGGSVYGDSKHNIPNSTNNIFHYRHLNNKKSLMSCSFISCGIPGNPECMGFKREYLPQPNPEDCIILCSLRNSSYAMVGWDGTISSKPSESSYGCLRLYIMTYLIDWLILTSYCFVFSHSNLCLLLWKTRLGQFFQRLPG